MKRDFKIGEVVVVKEWEEMEVEYGIVNKHIPVPGSFTLEMKKFCGEMGEIVDIKNSCNKKFKIYTINFDNKELNKYANFIFSTDMLRLPNSSNLFEKEWISKMMAEYMANRECTSVIKDDITIVVNKKTLKTGVAKCCPTDTFDTTYGIALAYARLIGEEIPNFDNCKEISDIKLSDKFKYNNSIYKIIGKNPVKEKICIYEIYTGETKELPIDTLVEIIK